MRYILIILLLSFSALFSSCQKVVDIDLNSSEATLIVEGKVADGDTFTVKLRKSVNFDEPNQFPAVINAQVSVIDELGNKEDLNETSPGQYKSNTLKGTPGRTYTLSINVGKKTYTGQSAMAAPVTIDTVVVDSINFGRVYNKYLYVVFQDPPQIKNYYKVIEIINGDTLKIINILSDDFRDGKIMAMALFSDQDPKLKSGDKVTVLLQTIDKPVYDYLRELVQVINGGQQTASPANPDSNINNGALGYFSAYSQRYMTIIVP